MAENMGKDTKQKHIVDAAENAIAADTCPNNARKSHVHHQFGGIIMQCDDSDCEAESNHIEGQPNLPHNHEQSQEFVPDSAASSSGIDRQHNEILRSMHPMRNEIVGASDDICLDTENSSIKGLNCGQPYHSPWLANNGNFLEPTKPLKVDLLLPQPSIRMENNILQLEETDYTPISLGWGFSLLGFFIERFPGKDAVHNLTKRWTFPARVSFHPKGWIIFRFETEAHSQAVLNGGPYHVFGIPLILCLMPSEFRFDSSPVLNFKVWASLPNLPLELWNASAISKIASTVGTPLEVDHQTISKNYVAGPRVLILVDGAKEPPNSITLKLHNGNTFDQPILLDYYPYFCTRCRRAGHLAAKCRALDRTNPGTRLPPRNRTDLNADTEGWLVVRNKKSRSTRSRSRQGRNQSKPRDPSTAPARSKSRPPKQQWQPKILVHADAATTRNGNTQPVENTNTHIYFESPTSSLQKQANDHNGVQLSNKYQPFDDLEQLEDATKEMQHQPITPNTALNQPQREKKGQDPTLTPAETIQRPQEDRDTAPIIEPNEDNSTYGDKQSHAEPEQHKKGADQKATATAIAEHTTATTARYRPPAARHVNTIHRRANSDDTFSTECIHAESEDKFLAARNNKNKTDIADQSNAPFATSKIHSEQVPPTYAIALTSPNHIVAAGTKQNQGKQKIEEKLLDPRPAIKNKKKQVHLSSTGGRVLATNIPSKNRK